MKLRMKMCSLDIKIWYKKKQTRDDLLETKFIFKLRKLFLEKKLI